MEVVCAESHSYSALSYLALMMMMEKSDLATNT